MPDPVDVAHRLYDAFAHADADALRALLTEDFEGVVSAGMPHGVGGSHHGPDDMLGVWGTIATQYEMTVEPSDFLPVDDGRVVVVGRYHGPARDGRSAVDAAFAHVLVTRGERIAALQQITDTARWGLPR